MTNVELESTQNERPIDKHTEEMFDSIAYSYEEFIKNLPTDQEEKKEVLIKTPILSEIISQNITPVEYLQMKRQEINQNSKLSNTEKHNEDKKLMDQFHAEAELLEGLLDTFPEFMRPI